MIKVSATVLEGLKAVHDCDPINMWNVNLAIAQAVALGYPETARWIEQNQLAYIEGVSKKFIADSDELVCLHPARSAIIDPAIRKLHPELQEAAYLMTENPGDKVVVLTPGDSVVLDEYQLSIKLIKTGGEDSKGQQYADLELMFSHRERYNGTRHDPGNNGFVPNPMNYPRLAQHNLLSCAQRVYRTHRLCTGEINRESWNNGLEIIELAGGYRNYVGRSRFYEQCFLDGSFDTYYEEHCDFGIVRLMEGIVYNLPECRFLLEIKDSMVQIEVVSLGNNQYQPIYYEKLFN